MSALARLALLGLVRAPSRTVARVLTLAAAVALLGAMVLFVGHSLRTMTSGAVRSVPLDWQGPVPSGAGARRVASEVARQPGVLAAAPVATAPFAGVVHVASAGTIRAGAGAILAVSPGYTRYFHTFRFLRGSLRPGEIVFDQQLAATLQVQPGDTVSLLPRPGARARRFRVSGVVLVTAPDVLFQPLNPLLGPAPAQPPADIAILPFDTFANTIAPQLPTIGTAGPVAPSVPGTQAVVQWQVQAQVDPHALAGSPAHALLRAGQIRNAVERSLPGQVVFVDNLADSLNSAAGDALYAETLYIMLAVPGALVALALAYLAALGTVERDRRDLALLRARGASRRSLLFLAAVESAALGAVAGGLGTGGALLAVRLTGTSGGIGGTRVTATFALCVVLAFAGAVVARIAASAAVLRVTVSEGRRGSLRPSTPLWQRLYLDLICLTGSGLVYWLTVRTGFSAVVSPDSNPTLSLSVYMFFAPALLWLGAALFVVRLRGRALAWVAVRVAGGRTASWRRFLLVSAARRGAALNRGVLVVGLLLAFGVNLAIFAATYDQQVRVDAQLTLGADVVVTAPPGVIRRRALERQIAALPGIAGTTAIDHSYAYVGPDLQDIFGVDAGTLTRGTSLRDSYFIGGSAGQMLARLQSTPDGVLVSKETISDYSLQLGDLLKLRALDRTRGRFQIVHFHVVGIVQEFPGAPRDSFMVANLAYLERVTHDPGPNVIFTKARSDPVAVARRISSATRSQGTLVKNIRQQTVQTVSSITTVDLGGISKIEEAFALLLASAATALFVAVALAERRQEFATMAALGASLRGVARFLWSEAALVVATSIALASVLGWLLAEMLVAMLRHVFDPPPDHLALPWAFLAGLFGAAILGALVATAAAAAGIRRLPLGQILREE
jgi:putative ABC transport system permease protein